MIKQKHISNLKVGMITKLGRYKLVDLAHFEQTNLQQKLLDWKWPLLSKNWRFENFTKALTPCCQCCQCVSYEVTEGRYQCVCLLYAGRFPIITNIGLWTLLTDIVPHAMQRVVLFVRWQNKKTCNSHFSCASWSTAKSPDMSKTLGQSKRFPKLLFNLQFSCHNLHISLSPPTYCWSTSLCSLPLFGDCKYNMSDKH